MASREVQRLIYEDTGGRCWYCGASMHPLGNWQVEHQHPRAKGGTDVRENLVAACRDCNVHKGNRTVEEYRHSLRLKLEAHISQAREIVGEIEGYIGWDNPPYAPANGFEPPSWLIEIDGLLEKAGELTVHNSFLFYGETPHATGLPSRTQIEESETVA